MINKQSIYYWFFFPLLALLSAGSLTSCIYDSVLEETDMSGKSTLSITMRGITTTDPSTTGGNYDDYVKTLRVIGFDASGSVVCNQLFDYVDNSIPNFEVTESEEVNITQTLEDTFQGGVCDFYFIANETDYTVYDAQTTSQSLSDFVDKSLLSEDDLKNCVIAYTGEEPGTTNALPILMTTSVRSTLKPGDNTINNIELVRCFAKVQLKIIDKTGSATVGENPVLTGTCPEFYSLWDGSTTENWTSFDDEVNIRLELKEETIEVDGQTYSLHTSQEIYFPERLFDEGDNNKDANAMKFSFTLNGKLYEPAIANSEGTDFNIRRNTHYTVIATLNSTPVNVTFNIEVTPWTEVEVDVPPFN